MRLFLAVRGQGMAHVFADAPYGERTIYSGGWRPADVGSRGRFVPGSAGQMRRVQVIHTNAEGRG